MAWRVLADIAQLALSIIQRPKPSVLAAELAGEAARIVDHWTEYSELNSVLEDLVTSIEGALGDAL